MDGTEKRRAAARRFLHVRRQDPATGIRRLASGHCAVVLLLATSAAISQAQGAPTTAAPAPGRGEVHGRIVNASGGLPIATATVQLVGISDTTTIARCGTP